MSGAGTDLSTLGAAVEWPDHEASVATGQRLAGRGLGSIAELAGWVSGVQGATPPRALGRTRAVVFGAQPGLAVQHLAAGLDVGVRYEPGFRVAGTAAAIAAGVAVADEEIETGADLLVAAHPDTGTSAAVIVSILTNTEPAKVMARGGAATDPEAWMARTARIRDERRAAIGYRSQPDELLAAVNAPMLAATAGFLLRAAARRTPVVIDGLAAAAAALVAYEAQPRVMRWWRAADAGSDPAQGLALTALGLRPMLGLGSDVGDGTAGLLCVPVLRAAVAQARVHPDD